MDNIDTRVQVLDGEASIEVLKTVVEKTQHKESALLRERSYFEGMKEKAEAGLARVNALLSQINNEKGVI